jgi:hypothetical protein
MMAAVGIAGGGAVLGTAMDAWLELEVSGAIL